jgi:CrcB protein
MELALNRRHRLMAPTAKGAKAMAVVIAVGVGGALGAVARYGLDAAIEPRTESIFPWATLAINTTGCFAVGFVIAALVDRHHAPQWLRAALVVGFCGGYTTFSTFAQETLDLAEGAHLLAALTSIIASVSLGLLAVFIGGRIGRLV